MPVHPSALTIRPADALRGCLPVPCAKNSVLPLMAASLLCAGPVRLYRVPALSDVELSCAILADLGSPAYRQEGDLLLRPSPLRKSVLEPQWMSRMRSGIFFLAPVLARTGRVEFEQPGGCDLGARPVDIHLAGLCAMGARCETGQKRTVLTAPDGLRGCEFELRLPSVGATETLLMAASVARGRTRLFNAAVEPEVLDLARFLNACGARVRRDTNRSFLIEGLPRLSGCDFTASGDRIWCATLLCAAAGCTGRVELTGMDPALLAGLPALLRAAGCTVTEYRDAVRLECRRRLAGVGTVQTAPYPGFATDMAPLLAAALLRAKGMTTLCDTVFSHRFACAEGFSALGAPVRQNGACLTVGSPEKNPPRLCAAGLRAPDLRGGAALVLAALQAGGTSRLEGCELIARGYEDLPGVMNALGACLQPA